MNWRVIKPPSVFFARALRWSGYLAEQTAYVGDHKEYNVRGGLPARPCTEHFRRGPVRNVYVKRPGLRATADRRVNSLEAPLGIFSTRLSDPG